MMIGSFRFQKFDGKFWSKSHTYRERTNSENLDEYIEEVSKYYMDNFYGLSETNGVIYIFDGNILVGKMYDFSVREVKRCKKRKSRFTM